MKTELEPTEQTERAGSKLQFSTLLRSSSPLLLFSPPPRRTIALSLSLLALLAFSYPVTARNPLPAARGTARDLSQDAKSVMRQALGGLLWSKQFYYYDMGSWLNGEPAEPAPPSERLKGRNSQWTHLYNDDIISMPDKWEYPWYAAWDLAFHCVPLAIVDSDFAKDQLVLLLREWYMHPSGTTAGL